LVAELRQPAECLSGDDWEPDRDWCAARLSELLLRAEQRAWVVEAVDEPLAVTARCPIGTGSAVLAYAREPIPSPTPGAFLVGRSVPFGPNRYLLIGRPAVVSGIGAVRLAALIASLRAPRGEFWRVHGAVLLRAARTLRSAREHEPSPARAA
jgi:hypothetical protein